MMSLHHSIKNLVLSSGTVLPEVSIAYTTMGTLAPDGRNAVLLTHGYTSGHDMASPASNAVEGSWSELVGPGKPIDTDRFFVVCPNMLGSSYGSTNAASIDPNTGAPYGSRFPDITFQDIVETQWSLVDALGIRHLAAVAGPSMGGFQALQWAIDHPDFVDRIVVVTSAPFCPAADVDGIVKRLSLDPNWNDGNYYACGNVKQTLARMRADTLHAFGVDTVLADAFPDANDRGVEIQRFAQKWAERFDANSLIILMNAANSFDVREKLDRIKARVFYALSTTDRLFPPTLAEGVMRDFEAAGVRAEYHAIESNHGHFASGVDSMQWSEPLRKFMSALIS